MQLAMNELLIVQLYMSKVSTDPSKFLLRAVILVERTQYFYGDTSEFNMQTLVLSTKEGHSNFWTISFYITYKIMLYLELISRLQT